MNMVVPTPSDFTDRCGGGSLEGTGPEVWSTREGEGRIFSSHVLPGGVYVWNMCGRRWESVEDVPSDDRSHSWV